MVCGVAQIVRPSGERSARWRNRSREEAPLPSIAMQRCETRERKRPDSSKGFVIALRHTIGGIHAPVSGYIPDRKPKALDKSKSGIDRHNAPALDLSPGISSSLA